MHITCMLALMIGLAKEKGLLSKRFQIVFCFWSAARPGDDENEACTNLQNISRVNTVNMVTTSLDVRFH